MNEHCRRQVVVLALGNDWRRDDGVGWAVLEELRHLAGVASLAAVREPIELLDLWAGTDVAVVVDALSAPDQPGTVQVGALQLASDARIPDPFRLGVSSHGLGLVEVLRLAQQLGSAPSQVVVVGVVGGDFGRGVGLTEAVSRAVPDAARAVDQVVRAAVPKGLVERHRLAPRQEDRPCVFGRGNAEGPLSTSEIFHADLDESGNRGSRCRP